MTGPPDRGLELALVDGEASGFAAWFGLAGGPAAPS
jgi:hypothetical protein